MLDRARLACLVGCALLLAPALAACAADPWDTPGAAPSAIGTPAPGFAPTSTPSPEATVDPAPGSWTDVHPSPGYRVVLLTAGDDEPTAALVTAVQQWADAEHADLRVVRADDDHVAGADRAVAAGADLVVVAGAELVDLLAIVSANHLQTTFLVLGAEIAEPTANVTAVDWTGAGFRGEGLGSPTTYDAASFTPERTGDAIRAGVAAVLTGLTGVVLWID